MKILVLAFFLMCFQAFSESLDGAILKIDFSFDGGGKTRLERVVSHAISKDSTEAVFSFDSKKFEFCCEREQTSEPFFEMSEAESARIVQGLLGPKKDRAPLLPKPKKGQR